MHSPAQSSNNWHDLLLRMRGTGDRVSPYEEDFVKRILCKVQGINPSDVEPQWPFIDGGGKTRYADFIIKVSGKDRLAIEVDGFNKNGRPIGQPMTPKDWADFLKRQNALMLQGVALLRFSNSVVVYEPESAVHDLTEMLMLLRSNDSSFATSNTTRDQQSELLARLIDQLTKRNEEWLRNPPPKSSSISNYWKWIAGLSLVAFGAVSIASFTANTNTTDVNHVIQSDKGNIPNPIQQRVTTEELRTSPVPTTEGKRFDTRDAASHEGTFGSACGNVAQVSTRQGKNGAFTAINFDRRYPSQSMSAMIYHNRFLLDNVQQLEGKRICVDGVVHSYFSNGKKFYQIILESPNAISTR